ncbi:hypothetical protein F5888DRAFT_1636024 [Russula emetica]|nr:hypothetical protein F5888DRAFT_1636024 [Russula emetica]
MVPKDDESVWTELCGLDLLWSRSLKDRWRFQHDLGRSGVVKHLQGIEDEKKADRRPTFAACLDRRQSLSSDRSYTSRDLKSLFPRHKNFPRYSARGLLLPSVELFKETALFASSAGVCFTYWTSNHCDHFPSDERGTAWFVDTRSARAASVPLDCSGDADDAEGRLAMNLLRRLMRHSTTWTSETVLESKLVPWKCRYP